MNIEDRNNRNNAYTGFKASIDVGMGVMYCIISVYAMRTHFIIAQYGKQTVYTIGGLFIFYGLFRLYRGLSAMRNNVTKRR